MIPGLRQPVLHCGTMGTACCGLFRRTMKGVSMNAGTDLRPILGAMLIASVVLIIVNAILFSRSRVYEKGRQSQQDTPRTVAIILGIVGALAWTVVLWPVMTGSASGAYVIRVNGVVTSGGFLNLMYGLVPLFIAGLVLISLPLLIGRGLWNIRNKSADQKRAGKPGVGLLVLSIFVSIAIPAIFLVLSGREPVLPVPAESDGEGYLYSL